MTSQNKPYSGKNPVPTITTKLTALVSPEKATEAKAQQLQDQSAKREEVQTEKTASKLAKGREMHVTDPTTGEELDIRNAEEEVKTDSKGKNVLRQRFPPPDWKQHHERVLALTNTAILQLCAAFALSFLLSLFFTRLVPRLTAVLPGALFAYAVLFRADRVATREWAQRVWHAERLRGLRAGDDLDGDGTVEDEERTRESAEWANAFLRGLWPVINTDMFTSLVDMLEDIMQSSVPTFIHSVRVADIGLGSNAGRITSIRSLPDVRLHKNEDDGGDGLAGLGINSDAVGADDKDALDGDHVNLEVSFAYQSLPSGQTAQSKAQNVHLFVEFFLGLKNIYGFRVPVWVEVTGVVGTARVRLQLIPDPPFVKTTLVTLMGLPRITITVVPMSRILPNIMDLPFISGFISSALDTAAAEYVAPRSLTLDLQRLISGDDIKKDTEAVGVLIVHIHRATGVKAMDTTGSSADPYVTLTFSRLEKPLYSTRIIKGDCNPVFEETAVLIVDLNTVKLREKLSFQLWDSDRMSVDDMMGFAEVDIVDLICHRGEPVRRSSPLSSPDSRDRPGQLEYTIGYYGTIHPNPELKTHGSDPGIPEDLRELPGFKDARAVSLNDLEAAVLVTPPDPGWPSGLISIQVHEIKDLTVKMVGKGHNTGRGQEGEKGQDDAGQTSEEGEGLPSSYCTISLNDELVYETRVKPITSTPMFNAGTERFVRDWRAAHVTVMVKDSRMRENDAVLGTVFLKLSDLFVNASQITRCYPLENGLGSGRIRISLLFRPLEIHDISARSSSLDLSDCEVSTKITTANAADKISRKAAEKQGAAIVWTPEHPTSLPSATRRAFAVVWLRDLVDRSRGLVPAALWRARDGDYSRLKFNYVPPDGDLGAWDGDRENLERVGDVEVDLAFWPGLAQEHYSVLGGGAARGSAAPGTSGEAGSQGTRGGLRARVKRGRVNTTVSPEAVEVIESPDGSPEPGNDDHDGIANPRKRGEDGRRREGKAWRKHEKELHRDHRGLMQAKPVRTAEWIIDSVEDGAHAIKDRFKMKSREPDVETEV
ncbi:uncharacterized protein BXZ73DRAFT_89230 [Epithele typhae]|uniref:uncharacterized protein n=1 Tax=Epithele typhae TaxID=378194 RepID=UPI002007C6C5|nr:uncharacterized protein BXZ73DRAFT_89230 [Epithele typhae]KAH9937796.1 hypothetical protein BXZ73DRAFT_89230 [Epithele typhae]